MAGRRIAKSAVDWAAFVERVPPNQIDAFRAFKAKSDNFVSRVHQYPDKLPAIDWAHYKSRISAPGMVEAFEKAYQGVTVPYPTDKKSMKTDIDQQEKEAQVKSKEAVADYKTKMEEAKSLLSKIDSIPPVTEMTHEMYAEYFPDQARDPENKPTFWPHNKHAQPGAPDEIK